MLEAADPSVRAAAHRTLTRDESHVAAGPTRVAAPHIKREQWLVLQSPNTQHPRAGISDR